MNTKTGLSPIIKNLIPGLTERGKIKIGKKGEQRKSTKGTFYQLPTKLDHFIVTNLDRGEDNNFLPDQLIHKELGESPKKIPIKLLFDKIEMNFQCRYTCYAGKTLACSGDGERAINRDGKEEKIVHCPCERQNPKYDGKKKCKINGTLSVMVNCEAATVGGVWKFRTTGYNSTIGILSSLTLIKSITGGVLAGIPLNMTIVPKVATNPVNDSSVTIYVVGIEYDGNVKQLQDESLEISQQNAMYTQRIENMEKEALKLISVDSSLIDEAADIVEEFHPEEQKPTPKMKAPNTHKKKESAVTGEKVEGEKKNKGVPSNPNPPKPPPKKVPDPTPIDEPEQTELLDSPSIEEQKEFVKEVEAVDSSLVKKDSVEDIDLF